MKHIAFVTLVLVLCPLAFGQSGDGYVAFAPGQIRAGGGSAFAVHFGCGGRYIGQSGAGFGAELGIGGPKDHIGGGVTCWASSRVGLPVESRDHVALEQGTTVQMCGIRLGVAFN
jgi:hypothetical protein